MAEENEKNKGGGGEKVVMKATLIMGGSRSDLSIFNSSEHLDLLHNENSLSSPSLSFNNSKEDTPNATPPRHHHHHNNNENEIITTDVNDDSNKKNKNKKIKKLKKKSNSDINNNIDKNNNNSDKNNKNKKNGKGKDEHKLLKRMLDFSYEGEITEFVELQESSREIIIQFKTETNHSNTPILSKVNKTRVNTTIILSLEQNFKRTEQTFQLSEGIVQKAIYAKDDFEVEQSTLPSFSPPKVWIKINKRNTNSKTTLLVRSLYKNSISNLSSSLRFSSLQFIFLSSFSDLFSLFFNIN